MANTKKSVKTTTASTPDDSLFESLVAEAQKDYQMAQATSSAWMPDPGRYLCELTDIQTGTYNDQKTGRTLFFVKPLFKITDHPTLEGRSFAGQFMTNRDSQSMSFIKSTLAIINGEVIEALPDAVRMAKEIAAEGAFCYVTVKKRGEYVNAYIDEMVEVEKE